MSEMPRNDGFQTTPTQDFDTVGFQGSMQQVLQENIGKYVMVDFLIGNNTIVTRQGILYSVATQFIVLADTLNRRYIVCDIFNIRFVTFLFEELQNQQPSLTIPPAATAAPRPEDTANTPEMTPAGEPAEVDPATMSVPASAAPVPEAKPRTTAAPVAETRPRTTAAATQAVFSQATRRQAVTRR